VTQFVERVNLLQVGCLPLNAWRHVLSRSRRRRVFTL